MHILFGFLITAFVTPHTSFCMDDEPTPIPLTQQWLNIAYDFHTGKLNTHFKSLMTDVQSRIIAQVHPRQTIDELTSDHFILVRQLTVPYIITSWDMKNDDFIYYTKKERDTNLLEDEYHFDMYHLDLAYGQNTPVLKNETIFANQRPKLAICSNSVVFETSEQALAMSNFKNPEKKTLVACKHTGYANFACHKTLPLFVIVDTEGGAQIYDADEGVMLDRSNLSFSHLSHASKNLQWHPIFPFVMTTIKHTNGDICLHHLGLPEENGRIMRGYFNLFCGTPCIPYDGKTIWGGSGVPCARIISNYTCTSHAYERPAEIKNRMLRAVGEHYYLTEDKEENSENTCFTLRSSETKEEVKKITRFAGHDSTLSRLPQNHDYRHLTIAVDTQKEESTISIAVPASQACIEHYCMFQAALSAEKAVNVGSWDLFKNLEYTNLITATAGHYPHFKNLMMEHKIMKA